MPDPLTIGALIGGAKLGGDLIGGFMGNNASRRAQGQQERSLHDAGQISQDQYGRAIQGFNPFQQGGTQAFNTLSDLAQGPGVAVPQFDAGPAFSAQSVLDDPGYQFRLGEGLKGTNQSAAVQGGALGGQGIKDLAQYSQGLASQELGNAYNRFSNERNFRYGGQQDQFRNQMLSQDQRFGQLQDVAGFGERATGNIGQLRGRLGDILSGNRIQQGNVQAAGTMGRNQNNRNMLSGGINTLTDLMDSFGGGGAPGGGGQLPQGSFQGLDLSNA